MCSLVNAKSGGCAEDCGFCAQSKYAEADTPMHAMMEPEQILEHARAAEAAGAHRFCMVTQGQGLSKRDFEKVVAGARLVAEHTNLKRCASIGHMSVERAQALKAAGIQRVHHNVETAESYYPEVSSTVRYEGRLRTIDAVREAGLETCVGGILNLGETREQRVEMAFELAKINPTSVPINLLNPRPGTKFGDRELMDPWEVVKWIAIFRLILPEALFRLCGGRVENLGELQATAIKAGLNGVMMGNFLTTLGNTPDEDRSMFEELGLNVARQPDNGANPRPDNRTGWLEGETPGPDAGRDRFRPGRAVGGAAGARHPSLGPVLAAALQGQAASPTPSRRGTERGPRPRRMIEIEARLQELEELGLHRCTRLINGPQGPSVLVDGSPALLLCSNNYLGLADHPAVREAAAEAAMRWGAGAGASRLVSGTMTPHRRLEERLADVQGPRGRAAVRLGLSRQSRRDRGAGPSRETSSSPTRSTTRRSSMAAGCPGPRCSSTTTVTPSIWNGDSSEPKGRGALIVTDGVFSMDGDVAPLAEIVELAGQLRASASRLTRRTARARSGLEGAAQSQKPESRMRWTSSSARSARRSAPMEHSPPATARWRATWSTPPARSSSPPRRRRRLPQLRWPRSSCSSSVRRWCSGCPPTPRRSRRELIDQGFDVGDSRTQIIPLVVGGRNAGGEDLRAGAGPGRLRPGDPAADGPARHLAATSGRHGVPPGGRAAHGGARPRGGSALSRSDAGRASRPLLSLQGPDRARRSAESRHGRREHSGPVRGLFVTGTDTGVGKTVAGRLRSSRLWPPRDGRSGRSSR